MRKVKYQDTGEYGTNEAGYKAPNGKYYSSEAAWNKIAKNSQLFKDIYIELQDTLSLNTSDPVPSVIVKTITQYKERYDIVLEILKRNKEQIKISFQMKEICNPWHQAKYFQTVITNNYNIVKKELEELAVIQRERYIEPPTDISKLGHKNKSRDVTKLVGGFNWT